MVEWLGEGRERGELVVVVAAAAAAAAHRWQLSSRLAALAFTPAPAAVAGVGKGTRHIIGDTRVVHLGFPSRDA